MRLGMFMPPLHRKGWDYHEMYAQDVEACVLADEVGFDELWVGEHYSQRNEPIPNCLQFLAYLAPLTKRIKLGTGVLNLPHRHPAQVAGDVAMLDHLTRGRLQMGIGPGGLASDMEVFGTLAGKDRGKMMVECFDMILKIWESDPPYDIQGEYWSVSLKDTIVESLQQGYMLKPYQKPHPFVSTTAMSPFSGTAKVAGARGWGLMSANFNPWQVVKSHWSAYEQGAQSAGLVADRGKWRVTRTVLVTETDEQAEAYLARPDNAIQAYYQHMLDTMVSLNYLAIMKSRPDMADDEITIDYAMREMVIAGSPETVCRRLSELTDDIGRFGTLLVPFHEWDDRALWQNSYRLLAQRVVPDLTAKQAILA